MGEIRLGTSGYSFQDWKGQVYPSNIKNSEMFSYYIDHFRLNNVEINYTYYRQPSAQYMEAMVKKSPKDFDFTVKLFGGITHDPWKIENPPNVDSKLCMEFLEGIKPLRESGKLGCILAQFPPNMTPSDNSWEYLVSLPDNLGNLPIVYEFRNKRWICDKTLARLRELGIGFCAVDEPQIGPLMPLVPAVTSNIGYLRLHGRNTKWFSHPDLRYDYLYSEDELHQLIPVVEDMAEMSVILYVEFNNCHSGSAVRNVKMMQALLGMDHPPLQRGLF